MNGFVPLHGLGSRQDLPLPFPLVIAGAIAALVISFVVLLRAWNRPRLALLGGLGLPSLTRWWDLPAVRWGLRLLVLAGWLWMGLALVAGQDRVTNPVFGFVYVWVWVGLAPISLLFGPVWRALNPVRTIAALLPLRESDPRLNKRLGVWPAALAVTAFAWLELIQPDNDTLTVVRWWTLAWLVWTLGGALVFGRGWIGAADPFEATATLIARLSVWHRGRGPIRLVNPLRHVTAGPYPAGAAGLACALLGATAFDSFGNTTWWIATVQEGAFPPVLVRTLGLLAMTLIVGVSFVAACRPLGSPDGLTGALVPIVVGYVGAHYLSLLWIEGQRTAILASDPLGLGWNLFGTAELGVNTSLFDYPQVTATAQLGAIVLGHLIGVLVAHDRAIALVPERRRLTGQLPLLIVMIGYTIAGLVLLFSP